MARNPSLRGLAMALVLVAGTASAQQGPACTNCGVVESVQQVQRNGTKGIAGSPVTPGMAIGGVVGGVLGNQVGGGSGRTAATVLGAAGGAYAGHTIEKNRNQTTAYLMRVRMQDGSLRTIERKQPIARGTEVALEGKSVRVLGTQAARR